jgi:hypothetical protein
MGPLAAGPAAVEALGQAARDGVAVERGFAQDVQARAASLADTGLAHGGFPFEMLLRPGDGCVTALP